MHTYCITLALAKGVPIFLSNPFLDLNHFFDLNHFIYFLDLNHFLNFFFRKAISYHPYQ